MVRFAFYDFDDTLLKYDSMARLFIYYAKRHPLAWLIGVKLLFEALLYFLHVLSFQTVKETLLYPLRQMSDAQIEHFYRTILAPCYYPHVIQTMKEHAQNGVHVYIVSASPEAYLICDDLPVEMVIGTQLERKNGHWTNHIVSANCKGVEKVRRIEAVLKEKNMQIDYEHSFAYSDSDSDWPMMQLVKNRYRIDKKTSKIIPFVHNP